MDLDSLIIELCNAPSPSGFESAVRERIAQELSPFAQEIYTDTLGNLIAMRRCGKKGAKLVMLDAHMDEVGLIVTGHEKGFLRFAAIGGVDARMLPGCEVKLLGETPIFGVIGVMPPHALSDGEMDKALSIEELYIDTGLSQNEVQSLAPLGTYAVYASETQHFGDGFICGKSLDDRSCCAIAIKTMQELSKRVLSVDVCCLFSVQEEVGLRGATVGAYSVNPDFAIAIDVTHGSTPDVPKHKTCVMGGGPAICVGPNMSREFTASLMETAKTLDMNYQVEVAPGRSGTNAWQIQVSRGGVLTALVSLPTRYMHSPVETVCACDARDIVKLLTEHISKLEEAL